MMLYDGLLCMQQLRSKSPLTPVSPSITRLESHRLLTSKMQACVLLLSAVANISQSEPAGADGFMGVIKPIADDANIAMVYVTPGGIIVSVGRGFSNLFGHDIADYIGKPFRSICKDPEDFNKLLSGVVAANTDGGRPKAATGVGASDVLGQVTVMHKFGDEITVQVKVTKVRGTNL